MSQEGVIDIIGTHPEIPTEFIANVGSAVPIANTLEVLGEVVAAGTNPFRSIGSGNTITYQVQIAQAIASTNASNIGLAAFNSSEFTVDANGFVSLAGGSLAVDSFQVQSITAPGVNPVVPTATGLVTVNGAAVANHSVVLETRSRAINTFNLEIQYATSAAATDATKSGVAHFNSTQFSVDANGFVALAGGGQAIDSIGVQTGTSPIVPTVAGLVTINGAVVAAGTNPVRTNGTGANTMALEVQISQAIAAADATKIGLANFSSTDFAVAATGFVTLSSTGAGKTITGQSGGALSPTANNWNIFGATVAAGTSPVSTSGSGSTLTTNVQISQAIAATDATKIGLSNFNSAHFSVDANGFVSLTGGGQAIDSFSTDVSGPVSPNGAGNVAFTGATNIFSDGSVANTMRLNLQGTNHALYIGRGTNTASANLAVGTNGQVLIAATGADPAFATLTSSDSSITFTPGANTLSLQVAGGTTVGKTITGNTGGALSPTSGNWNIPGNNTANNGFATYSTGSGSTLTINSYGLVKWVVNPTAGLGTHQTIQAAVTAAAAGDTVYITANSTAYTEDVALKAGVNLAALVCDSSTPNVTIIGNLSFSSAGTVSISGIRLQTNSNFLLSVTGSAASIVNLDNCYFNCTNNTGISFTSSSASAAINISNYCGNLGTTGIRFFDHSSAGIMSIDYCRFIFTNTGSSTTTSRCSNGILNMSNGLLNIPLEISSTGNGTFESINIQTFSTNTTCFTFGGTSGFLRNSTMTSGTASAISISTVAVIQNTVISSSNANAITGAGALGYANISFQGSSSSTINPTITQTPYQVGKIYTSGISFDSGTNLLSTYQTGLWTPNLQINSSSVGITYTTQRGGYTRIGNVVNYWFFITLSSKGASAGVVTISNFPIATSTNGDAQNNTVGTYDGVTAAGYTTLGLQFLASSTVGFFILSSASGSIVVLLPNTAISNTLQVRGSGSYIID